MSVQFNFQENWHLVKPHLKNPELVNVLETRMNDLLEQRHGEDFIPYVHEGNASTLCSSTAIFCDECGTSPIPETYRSYQVFHTCHWIADWTTKLGELMFPDYNWMTINDEENNHSYSAGFWGDDGVIIFDILSFEEKREFLDDESRCTCWGNDEEDIEKYREQWSMWIEEMMKQEYEDNDDPIKFIVQKDYSEGEDGCYTKLFDGEGNVITEGDWYHDKIDEVIDGFFLAFDYLGEKVNVKWITINEDEDSDNK